jgi:hypothetical protein
MGWKYHEEHGWENDAMRKERYANVRPIGEVLKEALAPLRIFANILTIVVFFEIVYIISALHTATGKWQWVVVGIAGGIFFWKALISAFYESEGAEYPALLMSLLKLAAFIAAYFIVKKVLFPLLPQGVQDFAVASWQWVTGVTGKRIVPAAGRLVAGAAGIIAGITVIGKMAKQYGPMKPAGIAIAVVFIAATVRFILIPVFTG